jgi:RNA polymerase sigma-70 factor (ECF subfamily)
VTGAAAAESDAAERALVLRVQGGDTDAFEALVRSHLGRARAIARRLMQDPDDADDLVQEAFLRALERIATLDPARPFGPWFFRLLVNAGHDMHRRQKVRRTEPERLDAAARTPSPLASAEHAEIRSRFEAALAALPPRQRAIIWSFEVDGMSSEEIARELGITQVTVRWHLHQGRRTLRAALADLR